MRTTAGLQEVEAVNTTSFSTVDINEAGAESSVLFDVLTPSTEKDMKL